MFPGMDWHHTQGASQVNKKMLERDQAQLAAKIREYVH